MNVKSVLITEISHRVEELYFSLKKLKFGKSHDSQPKIIHIVEKGHFYSGGMADRFKGAVTAFAWSKVNNVAFRMKYVHPFSLSDYLEPASYDWRLKEGEFSEHICDVRVLYARGEPGRRLVSLKAKKYIIF